MIWESASEKSFLDSNPKVLLISGYFSCQSTSEQEHPCVLCIWFAYSKEPLHMWNASQSTQEEQSSNGMLLLGTAGCENILGKYLFNIVLDQKEKEALFFFYYRSTYEVQAFNHIQMAKYHIPLWNIILWQNYTNLHFLMIFSKNLLSFLWTSVMLGLGPQAV